MSDLPNIGYFVKANALKLQQPCTYISTCIIRPWVAELADETIHNIGPIQQIIVIFHFLFLRALQNVK